MPDIAAVLLRQAFDQRSIDLQTLEHGLVGPAGMAVDATEHQRLAGPAALVEQLAKFAAVVPVGRTHPGNADHIARLATALFNLGEDPLLKLGQRLDLIRQIGAEAVEGRYHRVAVAVDHAGHQYLAGQVDALRVGIGQGLDLRVAAHLQDLAILDRNRLHQALAGFAGKHLAVEQHQVRSSQGRQRSTGQRSDQ
uniref:Uncharacterized protein n=1 Tax=Pseudomonas fluorescens TaxID=294 RepID=A0A5E6X938_PSEFL|nr:hypothetical protein PS652_05243 [Pseudomonas fluorescens]